MKLGHDHLGRADAFGRVHVHRNAAAIVAHADAVIGVDFDLHVIRVTGQRLINAVIDHLIDHVVQARPVIGVADIHAGAFANSL